MDDTSSITPLAFSAFPRLLRNRHSAFLRALVLGCPEYGFHVAIGTAQPNGVGHRHYDVGNFDVSGIRQVELLPTDFTRNDQLFRTLYAYQNPAKWAATTNYALNTRIIPATPNGLRLSGGEPHPCTWRVSAPSWTTTLWLSFRSGTCVWWLNTTSVRLRRKDSA